MTQHVTFEQFEALYLIYCAAPDRPTCYVAYLRAEADMVREFGRKRYHSYNTFRTTLWRVRRARRKNRRKV